jgi:hypothetical protein
MGKSCMGARTSARAKAIDAEVWDIPAQNANRTDKFFQSSRTAQT